METTQLPDDPGEQPEGGAPEEETDLSEDTPSGDGELGGGIADVPTDEDLEAEAGDTGGGESEPADVGEEAPAAAVKIALTLASASLRYQRMSENPDHRGDIDKTFSAWVLGDFESPEETWARWQEEANRRVDALEEGGSNDAYIRKTLAWKVSNA